MEVMIDSNPPNKESKASVINIRKNMMAKKLDAGSKSMASVNAMKARPVPPPVCKKILD